MKTILMALVLTAGAGLTAAAATPQVRAPQEIVTTLNGGRASAGPLRASTSETQDYAAREAAATELESFEGGAVLGILGIVLLVLLILLLI